jgi:hypothetical protein
MIQENDDNIYYNITIFPKRNENYLTYAKVPNEIASYTENRTQAILDNPSEYYMAFVRFSIPALSLPLFVFPIVENQPTLALPYVNLPSPYFSPFQIKFTYLNNVIKQNVLFIPTNNAHIPPLIDGKYISNDGFYYVYSYSWFLEMLNNTMTQMWSILQTLNPLFTSPPYFLFDGTTDEISIVIPYNYGDYPTETVKIGINYRLRVYLAGFTAYTEFDNTTNEAWYNITRFNNGNSNGYGEPPAPITNPPAYLKITEEYSSINYWPSVKKIVWLSGSLPIKYEMTTNSNNVGGQAVSQPIITDFFPTFDRSAGDSRSILSYYQTGPYRLINLTSTTPLTKIDIKAMWEDAYGNLYDIPLVYGEVIDLKLAFFKKKNFNQHNK